ncbi:hypothetical protein HYDPIDRAFT_118507 [Hydnomerulius pinastri MD-312]|uniref:Unplaced genomic scaffold scaffold_54, whole genome shotgun sequence n=1 Tax=Hydnomerulius pinastri MD-312 TaxID=994086 RepID=A0A0C9V2D4_9AGAM|nr:hypothetical protein HYDPIDRAFT_118507 [Hydnomerulius pinastri MD-312]
MSIQMDRVHTLAAARPSPQIAPVNGQTLMQHLQNGNTGRTIEKPPSPERAQPQPLGSTSDERQCQMEQSLKRSVTLVIWYKPNCDPIRLTHEISTFPLFQLSHYQSVVSDLELTPASYLDAYNHTTGHWEQHMITTVRTIESEQRLLYKLRKSLLAGLTDEECRGLVEERTLQLKKKQQGSGGHNLTLPLTQLKRPVSESAEVPSAKRFYLPEGYPAHHVYIPPPMNYMIPPQTMPYAPPLASPPLSGPHARNGGQLDEMGSPMGSPFPSPGMNLQSPVVPQTPLYGANTPSTSPSTATRTSFPQHPHPPLKRWPNDYTVFEIAAGFRAMDTMVAQTPTATQRMAFERVFGCRYVKSTVCRHRGVYRKADAAVRALFEGMGNDERAVWGEFVRRVEGRPSAGKIGGTGEEEAGLHGEMQGGSGQQGEQSPQSAVMGQEQRGETNTNQMMAQMGMPHMGMQQGLQQVPSGHAPAYDPSFVETGTTIPEA